MAGELPVAPDAVNYRYGFRGRYRCQEPILTVSSEAVRSERTPGAAESPENWDWKARYGFEDAQRRQTMVPDTFSSPPFLPTVCDIFDFLCFQNAFVGGCP